jgi:hypothetical protein
MDQEFGEFAEECLHNLRPAGAASKEAGEGRESLAVRGPPKYIDIHIGHEILIAGSRLIFRGGNQAGEKLFESCPIEQGSDIALESTRVRRAAQVGFVQARDHIHVGFAGLEHGRRDVKSGLAARIQQSDPGGGWVDGSAKDGLIKCTHEAGIGSVALAWSAKGHRRWQALRALATEPGSISGALGGPRANAV